MASTIALLLLLVFRQVGAAPNSCVAGSADEYVCTNDPMAVGYGKSTTKSRGTKQRIDGSETEKRAVREVLQQMEDYFVQEVNSKREYESIRSIW